MMGPPSSASHFLWDSGSFGFSPFWPAEAAVATRREASRTETRTAAVRFVFMSFPGFPRSATSRPETDEAPSVGFVGVDGIFLAIDELGHARIIYQHSAVPLRRAEAARELHGGAVPE